MSQKRSLSLAALAAVILLTGCASGVRLQDTPVETRTPTPLGAAPTAPTPTPPAPAGAAGPTPQSQVATVDLTRQGAAAAAETTARIVYFDFDSFVIRDEFKPLVEGHARAMVADPRRRMVVEGHADERGSREYNLALGQRRAEAVVRSLSLLGVSANQVEAVSFGEERPAVQGSDEAAWARNRRAELRDR